MVAVEDLRNVFQGGLRLAEPLAPHTTFKIGGPADLFLEPDTAADAARVMRFLQDRAFPHVVLGNGSNVLIADEGFRGAVVSLEQGFRSAVVEGGDVVAGAGMRLAQFVDFCIAHGFGGTEMLAGIPGTLGGAVIMNAGAYGGEISTHLVSIDVVRSGEARTIMRNEAGFGYRTSALADALVLSARFRLPHGDRAAMKTVRRETMMKRNASQPVQFPNAGSIFKNPPGRYAAVLIQECGLKGTRIGRAEVSSLHANFIVNLGGATAREVVELIQRVRSAVHERLDVLLELEVKLIGFDAMTVRSVQ